MWSHMNRAFGEKNRRSGPLIGQDPVRGGALPADPEGIPGAPRELPGGEPGWLFVA
jgi:hypothetical protein